MTLTLHPMPSARQIVMKLGLVLAGIAFVLALGGNSWPTYVGMSLIVVMATAKLWFGTWNDRRQPASDDPPGSGAAS